MTTNSDGVPNPGDQQPNPADAAAAAAAAQQPQEEVEVDVDDQAVTDANAAVEAEEAAGGEGGSEADPGAAGQQQPSGQQSGSPSGQQQPSEPVFIPKARFDEVASQRDKHAQGEAYWRGVAEARGQPNGQAPPQQSQPPTPEARLSTIQAQQDALAKRFDDGEITFSDLTRERRAIDNQEHAIREEILVGKVKPAQQNQPANQGNDELYLNSLTAQLEQEHPWVEVFDKVGTNIDWKFLTDTATQNLIDRGVDPTKGSNGKYELRKEVAILADQYGPSMVAQKAKAKGVAIPAGQAPQRPMAQARAAKLAIAADQPPNLNRMTGTQGDAGLPSDSQIESMGEDQFDAMPEAQRHRLLGIT